MFSEGIVVVATAILGGTVSVVLAIACIRLWDRTRNSYFATKRAGRLEARLQPMVFLFQEGRLIDATEPARDLLSRIPAPSGEWQRLMQWLAPRFDNAQERLADIPPHGRDELVGNDGSGTATLRVVAEHIGGDTIRITLTDPSAQGAGIVVDALCQQAMEEELDLLRGALDQTPTLIWRQDGEGRVTWANSTYLRRVEERDGAMIGWPLPRLLEASRQAPGTDNQTRRAQLDTNGVISWFECYSHKIGDETMMFALPADAAVRAERSLREFVQTLTKTFADLPTGLAIFDRERNLQLFNPALLDLTGLPTGFLTARPTLFDLLDKLRELRMVPEPKDFRSWRQQMNQLESAAATGRHVETWSLPGGQTYRVTGRPHPDGAVAFLFEDITSEMSKTRQFRAELLMAAHVLDGIEDALIVFGPGGDMLTMNQSYRELWQDQPEDLAAALAQWQQRIETGPGFDALVSRLSGQDGQNRSSGAISGPDGKLLRWSVSTLAGGRRMLRFRSSEASWDQITDPAESQIDVKTARAIGAD
ncbi:PAS-domain containing protein [Paracoccus sp. Z330]|uniref:PAS-domain containing protein n=1 Tax=Paracoccus onchidii TaxID=3017813 RepID=A0ABT4ZFV5_9RHOB|nr:PAS-domain containing protein [Paracoccus onchidii]MDB6178129.1 PAS-domain containing protein [Paracoccus onchidii]